VEESVVVNNRVLGHLAVSRAFGDARFKVCSSSSDGGRLQLQRTLSQSSTSGGGSSSNAENKVKTPPYVTAEPVITVYNGVKEGDFLILGSDGIWDFLSSEDAVALVGRWTDDYLPSSAATASSSKSQDKSSSSTSTSFSTSQDKSAPSTSRDKAPSYTPASPSTCQYEKELDTTIPNNKKRTKLTESQEESFVFEDDHAGVHLIRNGLGGVRKGRLQFTVSLPPGKDAAKRYRDDITVLVVFFGQQMVS